MAASEEDAAGGVPLEPFSDHAGWQYRAEGGANIVISLPHQGRVLRFPKTTYADPVARLRRLADYRNLVTSPLLGEHGHAPWQVVRLAPDDLRRLAAAIEERRPLRRRVDAINSGGFALKMEDCAVFPVPRTPVPAAAQPQRRQHVYSVEIKAKQGFLGADDDLGVCSFCMKQYLKLKRGTVQNVSSYCPLDLFSGQFARFDRALRALLECPQNNLRVFRDGEFLFGARAGANRADLLTAVAGSLPEHQSHSPELLLKLWTHLMFTVLCTTEEACHSEELAATATDIHPRRCAPGPGPPADTFLGRMLHAQRLIGPGPTQMAQRYEQLTAGEADRCRVQETFNAPFSAPLWTRVLSTQPSDADDPVTTLQRYSIGATMRDCSLMITTRRLEDNEPVSEDMRTVVDLAGNRWLCLCRVMDLDPKHIQRVTRQRLKKEKSRELYLRGKLPMESSHGAPTPCTVSDEGIDHLLAVSGSPM